MTWCISRCAHGKRALVRPDERAGVELLQPELLAQLTPQRRLVVLPGLDAAARRSPPRGMRHRVLVLDEHDALVGVDEQRAHGFPLHRLEPLASAHGTSCRRSSYGTAAFAGEVDGST